LLIIKSAPNFKKFFEVSEVGLGFNSHPNTFLFSNTQSGPLNYAIPGVVCISWSRFQLSVTKYFAGRNIGNDPQVLFPKMSGRGGGRNNGRGGRGHGRRGGRGCGQGQNYTSSANTTNKGLCGNIGNNAFDYGQKSAADLMRTSWEKLVQYVGTNYGQDIRNELQNKITVDIIELVHSDYVLRKHGLREAMIRSGQRNIQWARIVQDIILQAAVVANDPDAPMKLEILQNEIAQ
jgi:hypothetical protein